jgi:hypothetical protein
MHAGGRPPVESLALRTRAKSGPKEKAAILVMLWQKSNSIVANLVMFSMVVVCYYRGARVVPFVVGRE